MWKISGQKYYNLSYFGSGLRGRQLGCIYFVKGILIFIFFITGETVCSQTHTDSLWSVWSNEMQHDTVRLSALEKYYETTKSTEGPDILKHVVLQMLAFSTSKNQKIYVAKSHKYLCDINKRESKWLDAVDHGNKSYQLFAEENDKRGMASSLWGLGFIYYHIGQKAKALRIYMQCIDIYGELNDSRSISGILNNIGLIYLDQNDYETALDYFERSVEIGNWDKQGNSIAKRNIVKILIQLGEYDAALSMIEQMIFLVKEEEGEYYYYHMNSLNSLFADLFLRQSKYELALHHYFTSLEFQKLDSVSIGIRGTETDIGELYALMGKTNLSIEWCLRGLKTGEIGGAIGLQQRSCECLYKAYRYKGDSERALEYLEYVQMYEDSLNSEETAQVMLELDFKKHLEEDSLRYYNLNLQAEVEHQKESRRKDTVRNLSLGFVGLLIILSITLFRRNRLIADSKRRIEKEKAKAESSERAKQLFLANMSHEIRTPMNAIKGMTDILIRRNPGAEQLDYLNGIKQSSESLLVIINDILDISKIEAGKTELECIPFSIQESLEQIHTIMLFKAEEKGLELKLKISDSIPYVSGDPVRLRQIVLNLVGNAIKFTQKGIVTFSAEKVDSTNDNKISIQFCISDSGIGIEEERANKIFDSFEQAYSDTSRKFGGTGLGLSISKKLVELQGGRIWVESVKGKGSQFYFTIPYSLVEKEQHKLPNEQTVDMKRLKTELKGIRILLAEDNAFNAIVAQEELGDAIDDVFVDVVENGSIAVEKYKSEKYDVILMDVQMPVMNGYEATNKIKSLSDKYYRVPIIAMTANVLKEEVDKCYQAGMDDFIGKPFDIDELVQKIYRSVNIPGQKSNVKNI